MIRNLPQLQKLDNVVVQPDEVADAMRRGIELIHPYDTDETIPYTNYSQPPGGPQSYQVHNYLLPNPLPQFFFFKNKGQKCLNFLQHLICKQTLCINRNGHT